MRLRRGTRWATGAGVALLLGIGTAGGMIGTAGAASGSSSAVSHTVTPVTTADVSFNVSVSGLTKSAVTITGTAQADFTNDAVALTVNLPAVVAKLIPGGSNAPEVVNAVLSGGTIYLEIPSLSHLVGEPWISIALPSGATSSIPGIFTKVASALGDVNAIITFAQNHHATVTSLGTAIMNGVSATGTKIVASLPGKASAGTLTASVWADSSDRLVLGSVSVSGAGKKGALGLTATVGVSSYGAPVTITVPPASEVKAIPYATVAKLLGKFVHQGHHGHKGHGHKGHGRYGIFPHGAPSVS
jgi:hypothetical protein